MAASADSKKQPDAVVRLKNKEAILYLLITETGVEKFDMKMQANVSHDSELVKEVIEWVKRDFPGLMKSADKTNFALRIIDSAIHNGFEAELTDGHDLKITISFDPSEGKLFSSVKKTQKAEELKTPIKRNLIKDLLDRMKPVLSGSIDSMEQALYQDKQQEFVRAIPRNIKQDEVSAFESLIQLGLSNEKWKDSRLSITATATQTFLVSGNYNSARTYCKDAQRLATEVGEKKLLAALKLLEADCVDRQGNILLARRMYETIKNELSGTPSSLLAHCHGYFAALLCDQGEFVAACREYQLAGEMRAQEGKIYEPAITLVRAASVMERINAHYALKLALVAKNHLSLIREPERSGLTFRSLYGEVCFGIGRIYLDYLRMPGQALELLLEAEIHLRDITEYEESYPNLLFTIAHAYGSLRNAEKHDEYDSMAKDYLNTHKDLRVYKLYQAANGINVNIDATPKLASVASDLEFINLLSKNKNDDEQLLGLIDERITQMKDMHGIRAKMQKSTLMSHSATILWKLKQQKLAIEYQIKACAEYPANVNYRTKLGMYLISQQRETEALEIGIALVHDYPDDYRGYMISATALFNTDQFDDAEQFALKASDFVPERLDIKEFIKTTQEKRRKNPFKTTIASHEKLADKVLKSTPPVGRTQFYEYLRGFSARIIDNTDVFWDSRKKRRWNQNPESIGKALLIQDLKSHGREFYTYSEVQISGGRIDIVLNLLGREYIIELKMCGPNYYGNYAEGGFQQLKDYMKQRRAEYGYLVVFDGRVHQTGTAAIPETIDLGDDMKAYAVAVNVLGVEAQ